MSKQTSINNSWDAIRLAYKNNFKFDIPTWQVKLWWFGKRPHIGKKPTDEQTKLLSEYLAHRQTIEREVAPWDVVIRLAILYMHEQLIWRKMDRKMFFSNGHFDFAKLNGFIYHILWSKYEQTQRRTRKSDRAEFYAPTWWMWALEHRHDIDPVLSKGGVTSGEDVVLRIADEIRRRRMRD